MLTDRKFGTLEQYDSTIVEYDDAKDQCTIFAADVSKYKQMTAWLSAHEGSYVSALDVR